MYVNAIQVKDVFILSVSIINKIVRLSELRFREGIQQPIGN